MPTTTARATEGAGEIAILGRLLLNGRGEFTRELARYLLGLGFSDEDKARMHELALKNERGDIAPQELGELDGYIKAGDLLAILKSKARMALKGKRR